MRTTKQFYVNQDGIKEIHSFLASNHKLGGDHFDEKMLQAWAQDAEFNLSDGNPAMIEIRAFDSVSGHVETYTISQNGIDYTDIEID